VATVSGSKTAGRSNRNLGGALQSGRFKRSHQTLLNTLIRIFKREQGVDRQSLASLFQAFGLTFTQADFTSPVAPDEASEPRRANPQQDWGLSRDKGKKVPDDLEDL